MIRNFIFFLAIILAGFTFADVPASERIYDHRFHFLDQDRHYNLSFSTNATSFLVDFYKAASDQNSAEKNGVPEDVLVKKVEIIVDGQKLEPVNRGKWLRYSSVLPQNLCEIKVYVGKTLLGHYSYTKEGRVGGVMKKMPGFNPKTLSSIWMRMLFEDSEEARAYTDLPPRVWTAYPEDQKAEEYFCDLHTHFVGAIEAFELARIAKAHRASIPRELIEKLGINYINSRASERPTVKWRDNTFYIQEADENRSASKAESILIDAMKIPINCRQDFARMEMIYEFRSSVIKQANTRVKKDIFHDMLISLAKQYKKMHVKYVEFSFSRIVDPDYLEVCHDLLPKLKKDYDVEMRFLVALKRANHKPHVEAANLKLLDEYEKYLSDPYLIGVDIMGEEKNPTSNSARVLARARELRDKSQRQNFQIRVHAGETPYFLNNINDAIEMGATRIGHGLFGVSDQTIELAKKNNVIIELNVDSNFALSSISSIHDFYVTLSKYVENDIPITFGTDGHGIYSSTIHTELCAAEEIVRFFSPDSEGFMAKLKGLLVKTNRDYATMQIKALEEQKAKMPKEGI